MPSIFSRFPQAQKKRASLADIVRPDLEMTSALGPKVSVTARQPRRALERSVRGRFVADCCAYQTCTTARQDRPRTSRRNPVASLPVVLATFFTSVASSSRSHNGPQRANAKALSERKLRCCTAGNGPIRRLSNCCSKADDGENGEPTECERRSANVAGTDVLEK
jgi:hypothetical protein